jgi:aspartyl-tRNA(Asn)/glutamyl-tRNA(Gln) amidotransferase subunit C
MNLTIEEINKVAALARLRLTSEEAARYAETISSVLAYMTILNEVDTSGVEPTFQVTGLKEVLREDIPLPSAHNEK